MPEDADVEQGLISTASPIGRALLNKEEGDEVTVTTPNGSRRFELVKLVTIHDECRMQRRSNCVITPDAPDRLYSTRLRTAVVLTGSGTAGAYHAGVLRALHEAGVKSISSPAAAWARSSAMFAAVDGGARLWEADGIWKSAAPRRSLRLAPAAAGRPAARGRAAAVILADSARAPRARRPRRRSLGLLLTLVGLERTGAHADGAVQRAGSRRCFARPRCRPSFRGSCLLASSSAVRPGGSAGRSRPRARGRGGARARACLAPARRTALDVRHPIELRGGAVEPDPRRGAACSAAARRARRAGTSSCCRRTSGSRVPRAARHGPRPGRAPRSGVRAARRAAPAAVLRPAAATASKRRPHVEAFDLAGVARDHALDALAAALAAAGRDRAAPRHVRAGRPVARGDPPAVRSPGALARLLEEVAAAGAEQVILRRRVAAAGAPARAERRPRRLRGRAGEQLAAFEAAGLRDVLEQFAGRFAGLYVIRPAHNPLGPLDFAASTTSDRTGRHTLAELRRSRLRGRVPPVHRAGRRRQRRAHRDGPTSRMAAPRLRSRSSHASSDRHEASDSSSSSAPAVDHATTSSR